MPRDRLASLLRQRKLRILRNSGSQSKARQSKHTTKLRLLNTWTRELMRISLEKKTRTTSMRKKTLGLKTTKRCHLTPTLILPIQVRSLQMPRQTRARFILPKKTALR
jgi:hypothetical protein